MSERQKIYVEHCDRMITSCLKRAKQMFAAGKDEVGLSAIESMLYFMRSRDRAMEAGK